jgi:hypothetical protein
MKHRIADCDGFLTCGGEGNQPRMTSSAARHGDLEPILAARSKTRQTERSATHEAETT